MKDEMMIRMITETCGVLSNVGKHFPMECRYLHHSYNALLQAAQANHPGDGFLSALPRIEGDAVDVSPQEMHILFAQLRIALESLQESSPVETPTVRQDSPQAAAR